MSAQHTTKHNLEQYKKQAKELLKAYQSTDPAANTLVHQHLPRLSDSEAEGEISLQETQHIIARKQGFKDWNWLYIVCTLDCERLIGCRDRDLVVLLRESDSRDVLFALSRGSEALCARFLECVSKRLQGFLREEMSFLEEPFAEQVEAAQRRLLLNAANLALQGQLEWPECRTAPPREDGDLTATFTPRLKELAALPLEEMNLDQIAELWREIADQARREGIFSLDAVEATPLVREAIELMVDGTEPDLVMDILETRAQNAMLGGQERRSKMAIEALMAIESSDNSRIVHHKLLTFFVDYRAPVSGAERPELRPIEQVQAHIDQIIVRDLADMDYGEIAALFTDMAFLRRQRGLDGLRPYIDKTGYPLLRAGLELIVSNTPPKQIMVALEKQLDEELASAAARYRATIAGAMAVQSGMDAQETERHVREEVMRG